MTGGRITYWGGAQTEKIQSLWKEYELNHLFDES